jgi:acyl-CoA synthetase (AMP-forming)/AMP-acid ligase II
MNEDNIHELFVRAANNHTASVTFLDKKLRAQTFRYEELYQMALSVSYHLKAQGFRKGDTIALLLNTSEDFYASFFGAIFCGVMPTCLYAPFGLEDFNHWKEGFLKKCRQIGVKGIISHDPILSLVRPQLDLKERPLFNIDDLKNDRLEYVDNNLKAEDPCFLQFSSGTLGHPKAACISHENTLVNLRQIYHRLFPIPGSKTFVGWLPLYHDMGLIGQIFTSINGPIQLLLLRPNDFIRKPALWLKAITRYQSQYMLAPNFAYGLCTRRVSDKDLEEIDLSSVNVSLTGAEKVSLRTINNFIQKFSPCGFKRDNFLPVYGMSESTLAVTFAKENSPIVSTKIDPHSLEEGARIHFHEQGEHCVSVGKTLGDTEIKIVNTDNGDILPEGHLGEVYIKGKSIFKGYYRDPELSRKAFEGDFFKSGDYGFIYDDNLYIVSRKKEVIIINGKNYDPFPFEESLGQLDFLKAGRNVVFSAPIPGEDTEGLVVLAEVRDSKLLKTKNAEELKQEIIKKIRHDHQINPHIVELYPANTFPRTSSGKLQKVQTKKLWSNSELNLKNRSQKQNAQLLFQYFLQKLKNLF